MAERLALVVDDVGANREFVVRLLNGAKFRVISASTGKAALELIVLQEDDLPMAIVDMKLPDMSGLDLVIELRRKFPRSYLVVASMYDERSTMDKAFAAGCNVYLVKPHGFMELYKRLIQSELTALCADPPLVIDQYGPRLFKPLDKPATGKLNADKLITDKLLSDRLTTDKPPSDKPSSED
jgi:CheY-like chemotaxis protein